VRRQDLRPAAADVVLSTAEPLNWTDMKASRRVGVRDGFMESVKGRATSGRGRSSAGTAPREFATPSGHAGQGGEQRRLHPRHHEVQVLDSYENTTYPDGQCGALYGRAVPLVNASCKPGQWQTYDIIYHRPVFDQSGKVTRKAVFTVIHNGVLIQDHVALEGGTGWVGAHSVTEYAPHADKGPLMFQDHNFPVRFRNVWLRELKD
jgi:hypothetical protein